MEVVLWCMVLKSPRVFKPFKADNNRTPKHPCPLIAFAKGKAALMYSQVLGIHLKKGCMRYNHVTPAALLSRSLLLHQKELHWWGRDPMADFASKIGQDYTLIRCSFWGSTTQRVVTEIAQVTLLKFKY